MDSIQSFVPPEDMAVPVAPKVDLDEQVAQPNRHGPWERLITELNEFLAPWPQEIDDFSLASYLADMATLEEQAHMEQALAHCPYLATAIQISREVMNQPLYDKEG